MFIYKLTQEETVGYDTYDAMVVIAKSAKAAKMILPNRESIWTGQAWASSPDHVTVTKIGKAEPGSRTGIVLSSFNAG